MNRNSIGSIVLTRTLLLAAAVFLSAAPARAVFVEIDDFEDGFGAPPVTDIDGLNGWTADTPKPLVADPADLANTVLNNDQRTQLDPIEQTFKAAVIAPGSLATAFFRFRIPDQPGNDPDLTIGGSMIGSPDQVAVVRLDGTVLKTNDGGAWEDLGTLSKDTWYSAWMVIDSAQDEMEVYIEGGAFLNQTQLGEPFESVDPIDFRNADGAAGISRFFMAGNLAHSDSGDSVLIDDIFLDTSGENLANPVPEPATLALLGVTALVIFPAAAGRRKRN